MDHRYPLTNQDREDHRDHWGRVPGCHCRPEPFRHIFTNAADDKNLVTVLSNLVEKSPRWGESIVKHGVTVARALTEVREVFIIPEVDEMGRSTATASASWGAVQVLAQAIGNSGKVDPVVVNCECGAEEAWAAECKAEATKAKRRATMAAKKAGTIA